MPVFCLFLEELMEHLHSDTQPQVVLSQPAKAAPTVVEAPPAPAAAQRTSPLTVPPLRKEGHKKKHSRLWKTLGLLALLVCTSLLSIHLYASLAGTDESVAIGKVYDKALPSVVLISAEFPGAKPEDATESGTGSGVVLSYDGLIVTNAHVVQDAVRMSVTLLSGKEYPARLVGLDENTDLAVLKIDAKGLIPAQFAQSLRMRTLRVGETAIAVGNPLGAELSQTLTTGVLSAVGRGVEVGGSVVEMLQTDAAVSPGNSGGPLYDIHGRIIGIITSKVVKQGAEGIGFALPADLVQKITGELIEYGGVVSRPMLGVTVQTREDGLFITEITPGSAVERAGLQLEDRIVSFNGRQIETVNFLNYLKEQCGIGQEVVLTVERDGQKLDLHFKLEGAK